VATRSSGLVYGGSPPVKVAQDPHYRWHNQHPDDGGIEGVGSGDANGFKISGDPAGNRVQMLGLEDPIILFA
jgi:hypothetical protein